MKRWLLKRTKIDTAAMARDLGIRRATAAVLANRELSSRQAARSFLYGGTAALGNPLEMKDFSQAVSLLAEAIRAGKRIAVYGDYDVDGVMSTSILYQTILRCGGNAVFYLPHRQKDHLPALARRQLPEAPGRGQLDVDAQPVGQKAQAGLRRPRRRPASRGPPCPAGRLRGKQFYSFSMRSFTRASIRAASIRLRLFPSLIPLQRQVD